MSDDTTRELAIAILTQAADDLRGTNATKRRKAAAFIRRTEDFGFWCALAGLDPAAACQYLGVREAALCVTKPSRAARDHVTRHQTQYCTPSEKRGDDAERNKCCGAQRE
jgi:hypothetical protein